MVQPAPTGASHRLYLLVRSRAFWLALLLAQCTLVMWLASPWIGGDTPVYLALADGLGQGCFGHVADGICVPDALRPPGYPLALVALSGLPPAIVIALQLALCVAAFLIIDRTLSDGTGTQLAFRALTLAYPFAALYSASLQTEAWAIFLVTLAALLLCASPPRTARLVLVGVLLGLAGLIRTDLILLPFVASLVAALLASSWRALLPLMAAGALLLPYAVWNNVHFGRLTPMPVASAVGNSLYLATWQQHLSADDLNSIYSAHPSQAARRSGITVDIARLNRSIGADPVISPFNPASYASAQQQAASSRIYRNAALRRITADPFAYARHVASNVWALWNSSRYPVASAAPLLYLAAGLVFLLGLVGSVIAIRSRSRFVPALAFLAYPMLVHLPFHTEARYTAAARPLLLLFAAIALGWLWERWSRRHRLDDGKVDGQRCGQAGA